MSAKDLLESVKAYRTPDGNLPFNTVDYYAIDDALAELARFRELEQIAERMAAGITKERLRHTYERTTFAAAIDFMAWKESAPK